MVMFALLDLCLLTVGAPLIGRFPLLAWLFVYGAALEVVGWAVSPWIPVIKPIFTLSFTAQAMGWCVISLAVLYVLTDILMLRRGLGVIVLFGQYALTAYLVGVWFSVRCLRSLRTY
jgi:predicted acyltransferase